MVKRHYIQDYSENFKGNTESRTVASDFIRPSIESSLTRRGKKRTDQTVRHNNNKKSCKYIQNISICISKYG